MSIFSSSEAKLLSKVSSLGDSWYFINKKLTELVEQCVPCVVDMCVLALAVSSEYKAPVEGRVSLLAMRTEEVDKVVVGTPAERSGYG
jgi:hypothetical protein